MEFVRQVRLIRRVGVAMALLVWIATAAPVRAQREVSGERRALDEGIFAPALSPADLYGNAQFGLPERRPLGLFQSETEQAERGTFLLQNRRTNRRGGTALFALPGELLGLSTLSLLSEAITPSVLPEVSSRMRLSFRQYGGFRPRMTGSEPDGIATAFARRHALVEATSLNAPVHRALARSGSMMSLRSSLARVPFVRRDLSAELPEPVTTLYQRLDRSRARSHAATRNEAWLLFSEGRFRQAASAFESALTLDHDDFESRIGEIFCYASTDSIRTAATLMAALNERDDNPFLHDLNIIERYETPAIAQRLRARAGAQVDSIEMADKAGLTATYIFILWYIDRRDDAIRGATTLARAAEGRPYVDWPAKMKDAQSASEPSRIEP